MGQRGRIVATGPRDFLGKLAERGLPIREVASRVRPKNHELVAPRLSAVGIGRILHRRGILLPCAWKLNIGIVGSSLIARGIQDTLPRSDIRSVSFICGKPTSSRIMEDHYINEFV